MSCSILFVDDFPDERDMYTQCLEAAEFHVRVFDDVDTAFADALTTVPDAVISRLRTRSRELVGTTLTMRLRAHEVTRHVPVLIITSSILAEDRQAATLAGCNEYLLLPCLPSELVAVVKQLIAAPDIETSACRA